ncbi:MerR family transcriptional regulator [Nocardia speluncae]|uniref:MerR family transcriptional regulator n=1 Tax=Nocardia speluncae TaxID=419477 RepID=A0A846XPT4_9NOCA|nr:MerR family transcriptional regulator [Nocardia speluncae]NKY37547.1 MerR family transcriptional regulator [Nocardia speluncae]
MRIRDLSVATGASPRMLRHYEGAGILSPERDTNGYRNYRPEDAQTVEHIRCLLASGLSLSEASAILQVACIDPAGASDSDREAALVQLDERTAQLDAGIARLQAQKAEILGLRSSIETQASPTSD